MADGVYEFMPCYYPITVWKSRYPHKSGKDRIIFDKKDAKPFSEFKIPCGQCVGCRLEKSRQWAVRCYHESQMWDDNCFITLTYDDEHLPEGGTLVHKHFQDFMKRLRKKYPDRKVRYFQCGEYGEENLRPHYHACLFNMDFEDKILFTNKNGVKLFISPELEKLWECGFTTIGEVTFESAAYVARYIMKKITGKKATELRPDQVTSHYERLDADTGQIYQVKPEYVTMSRGGSQKKGNLGGIGKSWYDQFSKDVHDHDYIVINNVKMKPPKYYDTLLEKVHEQRYEEIKEARKSEARKRSSDNTSERLRAKETVAKARLQSKVRTL